MFKKGLKRLIAVVLLAISIMSSTPTVSYAHDAFFIQSLVDENRFLYAVNVVEDNASTFNAEKKHIEATLGDFSGIKNNTGAFTVPTTGYTESSTNGQSNMMFTFPSVEDGEKWFDSIAKNNASSEDANRAYVIKETLSAGLNDALILINGGKFKNLKELIEMSEKLSVGGTIYNSKGQSFKVEYGKVASYHQLPIDKSTYQPTTWDAESWVDHSSSGGDFVLITDGDGNEYEFVYRMIKGYHHDKYLRNGRTSYDTDAMYISWHHLMYQGNYNYVAKGFTSKNAGEMNKPGYLEEIIVNFFESCLNQLRNLLGLYSSQELVFNTGLRGSKAYLHGIMPKAWADNTMIFHWVFQAMAWSLIALAIIQALIKKNLSTINSSVRVNLIESVQDLLLTGFILANIFPVMQLFMFLNEKIVDVFGAVGPDLSDMSGINNYSNAIGGLILQVFYFVINIWLNFVYIMRALTIAILIASSPLFVVSMAFGGKWKQLFSTWLKELLCNIFLQSFHAFILSFFVQIQISARGIEGAVIAYALIPLTDFFKGLVMGNAGGFASGQGMATLSSAGGAVAKGVSGLANSGGRRGANATSNASGSGGSSSGGTNSDNSSSRERSSSDTTKTAGGSEKVKGNRQAQIDTKEAHGNREVPLDKVDNDFGTKNFDIAKGDVGEMKLKDDSYADNLSKIDGMDKDVKNGRFEKGLSEVGGKLGGGALSLASGGLKLAGAGAKAMVGAGVLMAIGSTKGGQELGGNLIHSAGKTARSGVSDAFQGIKSGVGGAIAGGALVGGVASKHRNDVKEHYAKKNEKDWKPMESEMYAKQLENGEREVHRDGTVLQQEGLVSAQIQGKNTALTYDMANMSQDDRQNLQSYASMYRDATRDTSGLTGDALENAEKDKSNKMTFLRNQGVERIGMTPDNNVVVTYNDAGTRKLGMKSAYSTGDGRIVETKRAEDPIATRKTFVMDKYVEKTQSQNNGHKHRSGHKKRNN